MLRWLFRRKPHPTSPHAETTSPKRSSTSKSPLAQVQETFRLNADVVCQKVQIGGLIPGTLVYFNAIVDMKTLNENVIVPLREKNTNLSSNELLSDILSGAVTTVVAERCPDVDKAVAAILEGQVALFIESGNDICLFPLTRYSERSVTESQNETVIVGPQEAFVENLNTNMSLVRHKIKHPDFKTIQFKIGTYTQTDVYVLYVEGLCDARILQEVQDQLAAIRIDSLLGASYLTEYLDQNPASPFPVLQYSERPDTLVGSLLEGRIGIMMDGAPQCLIVPVTFFTLMQSPEDYYSGFLAASWIRWIRFFFVIASFLVPSIYVAVTTFHPEMLPSNLLLTLTAARENIPFPALAEVLIMELTFEGLREAGIRIPRPLGQTVSIIGAIVIGQATVQAGVVSAPTVIVVSITGIASFIIPHFELGLSFRLLRFPLLILGGTLGMLGVIMGLIVMFWHLTSLSSFGVPYLHPLAPLSIKDWKDVFIRTRWPAMKRRPEAYSPEGKSRQDKGGTR